MNHGVFVRMIFPTPVSVIEEILFHVAWILDGTRATVMQVSFQRSLFIYFFFSETVSTR